MNANFWHCLLVEKVIENIFLFFYFFSHLVLNEVMSSGSHLPRPPHTKEQIRVMLLSLLGDRANLLATACLDVILEELDYLYKLNGQQEPMLPEMTQH